MENFLNLNKLTKGAPYQTERKLLWFYLWLLIFEGALRKWILPGLQQPLLIVRDPIAIYLVCVGLQRGWIRSGFAKTMMAVSTISLVFTMAVGHHNLIVGLFGWRIYFFHFPMIFVMAKVLTRDDLMKMARFILYISIPMTVLVVMQFYSPQSAFVNLGVGADTEGAGFGGALGYFRPPGTFSFTSGYVGFQAIVGCLLLYYITMNSTFNKCDKLPQWIIIIMAGCYLVSIPTSISRTHFFQSAVFMLFLFIAALRSNRLKSKYMKFLLVGAIAVLLLMVTGLADTQLEAFNTRFESANETEGGAEGVLGNRYAGSFLRGLFNFNLPIFGYGIGIGTNFGARLLGGNMYSFGFNGEEEWSRVTGECGLIIGWTILLVRLFFSLDIWKKAYGLLVNRMDLLPWMLSAGVLLRIVNGQWAIPTDLGIAIWLGGMAAAAAKK